MDLLNLLTSEFYVHKSFLVTGTESVRNCTDMRLMKQGSDREGHYITRGGRQGWRMDGERIDFR